MSLPHRLAQADEVPPRSRRLDSTSRRPATTGRRALLPPPHLHHRQARASSDAPTKRPHGAQAIAAKPRHIGLTDGLPETYLRYVSGKKTSAATLDMATITPSSRLRPGPRTPRPGRAPSPATGGGPTVLAVAVGTYCGGLNSWVGSVARAAIASGDRRDDEIGVRSLVDACV